MHAFMQFLANWKNTIRLVLNKAERCFSVAFTSKQEVTVFGVAGYDFNSHH